LGCESLQLRLGLVAGIALGVCAAFAACGPQHSVDRTGVSLARDGAAGGQSGGSGPRGTGGTGGRGPTVPPKTANGMACAGASECGSGFCVDGLCCEAACEGVCRRCNLPGNEGRCQSVTKDQDPDDECAPEPATSCGRDGVCDGAGACQHHAAGTICAPAGCDVATERAASTCDGVGSCKPGATKSCAPAVCIEQSCGAPCVAPTDCQMGFYCDEGTCRIKRDAAAVCTLDAQCASGFCADGVCCNAACKEKCSACNGEGTVGTCTPVIAGKDPDNECPVEGIITCGNAGGCDGKGACRLHAAGTFCAHPTCTGSTLVGMSTCDGNGACKAGPKTDCAPFVCNGSSCWTACANNDQCKAPRTCMINTCK
jgi:hypothetical protein